MYTHNIYKTPKTNTYILKIKIYEIKMKIKYIIYKYT